MISYLFLSSFLSEATRARFGIEKASNSIEIRIDLTKKTFYRILRNPIMGNGPADSAFDISESKTKGYPHTVILEVFDEAGVPAGLLYLMMFLWAFRVGWRTIRSQIPGSVDHFTAVAFYALFASKFIDSFKTGSYAGSNMLYFLTGCMFAVYHVLEVDRKMVEVSTSKGILGKAVLR
jgi:O-antigen ligase